MSAIDRLTLDNGRLKRIIIHWTAGTHSPSSFEKGHYHFLISRDGDVHNGKLPPKANENTRGEYAAHTRGLNTGSIGLALCGMAGAVRHRDPGDYPITEEQIEACIEACVELCRHYGILPDENGLLGHSEVERVYGVKQRGKWDVEWLPSMGLEGRDCLDYVRSMVAEKLDHKNRPIEPEKEEEEMAGKTEVKAGIKTSEFWVTLVSTTIVTASDLLGHPLSMETVAGIVALVVGFAMTRLGVKKAAE